MESPRKIHNLKHIKPKSDFAGFSKLLILNPEKAHKEIEVPQLRVSLNLLKEIQPSREFALQTRLSLLEKRTPWAIFTTRQIFNQIFNHGAALGTAVAVLLVIIGASTYLSPNIPILSKSENDSLLNEAGRIAKDIDIQLEEINYYSLIAEKTTVALSEAFSSEAAHSNASILNREARSFGETPSRNTHIDKLFNDASN